MSINSKIELKSGITVEYHEVNSINLDINTKSLSFSVESYLNEEAKLAGKSPVNMSQPMNVGLPPQPMWPTSFNLSVEEYAMVSDAVDNLTSILESITSSKEQFSK